MKTLSLITAVTAALALSTSAIAADEDMEKCKIVKDGVGLIKANKADCAGSSHSCAGQNVAGDPDAWIVVPKGACEKINAGDLSGIPENVLDKINVEALKKSK